jgi:hypothetical protein
MPKGTYGIGGFCVVDGKPIPQDRLSRGSVTCSKECYDIRRHAQRAQQDEKECRYCRKPSTPEDRDTYARFRRLERKFPGFVENITSEQFTQLKKEWIATPLVEPPPTQETLDRVAAIQAAQAAAPIEEEDGE